VADAAEALIACEVGEAQKVFIFASSPRLMDA
jgi:hypothetical protein